MDHLLIQWKLWKSTVRKDRKRKGTVKMGFRDKSNSTGISVGSLIGENSVIEGNYTTSEATRIDGKIKGNIKCAGALYIGPKGNIIGNVEVESLMVSGEIQGDVRASGKVEITSTGKLEGDIQAKMLVIDENAIFNGRCNMSGGKTNLIENKKEEVKPAE